MTDKVPLDEQIAEVKRELALRENAYKGFVARQKMTQEEADEHIRRMKGVLKTLLWCQKNEAVVREVAERERQG